MTRELPNIVNLRVGEKSTGRITHWN